MDGGSRLSFFLVVGPEGLARADWSFRLIGVVFTEFRHLYL